MKRKRDVCPKCKRLGAGPYMRPAGRKDKSGKRRRYPWFSHMRDGKRTWCYLGKGTVSNNVSNIKPKPPRTESNRKDTVPNIDDDPLWQAIKARKKL